MIAEHEMAAHELLTAEDLVSRQVGSYLEAKNRVVPVPPPPGEVEPWGVLSSTDPTTVLRQAVAHLAAAQNNVDVMNGYTGASDHNTVHLPMTYGTLTSADVAGGQAGSFLGGQTPQDREGAGTSPSAVDPRAGADGRQERPGLPGAVPAPGMVAPNGAGEVGTPVVARRGTAGVPTDAAASADTRGGPRSASRPGVPVTPGGEASGGVAVRGGIEWRAGAVPARGPGGGGSAARGPRAGGQPRGEVRSPRAAADPRVAAARPGTLGGVPVGAARREEDTEHRAPAYLEEHDPEELFGSDVVVAPETIGLHEED